MSDDRATIEKFKQIEPQEVIVTYSGHETFYMELASVIDGRIGPFRPMGAEEMHKMGGLLMEESTKLNIGAIPRNLIYMDYNTGKYSLVWYTKPGFKKMFFKPDLHIPNGATYPVPGLFWKYHYGTVSLFAFKKLDKKLAQTNLFRAPFHNIHQDHTVCMGSGAKFIFKVENTKSIVDFMKSVEKGFYNSFFTTMHAQTVVGNLNSLWKGLADKATHFPESQLLEIKNQVMSLYESYNHFSADDDYDFSSGEDDDFDQEEDDDDDE